MSAKLLDFQDIKDRVSLHQVVQMLGIDMKQNGSQFRASCPVHGGSPRTLVVTPGKGFYCFATGKGGDQIQLYAHCMDVKPLEAAKAISEHYGIGTSSQPTVPQPQQPAQAARPRFDSAAYLASLDPGHEALQHLNISPETFKEFRAGYCNTGLNRGRLAIALCDMQGTIMGFCGRALDDDPLQLKFPKDFDARAFIFGADKVKPGPLYLARDPLHVLAAHESGAENVVAIVTEIIMRPALEALAVLMHEKNCESVDLF